MISRHHYGFQSVKFADDIKCNKAIHNFHDSQSLQLDVDSLFQWCLDNMFSSSINKSVVLQLTLLLGECMALWGEPNEPSIQHHVYIFMQYVDS